MNDSEYRRKTHPEWYVRSWPLTITSFVLAGIVIAGIFMAWRYLEHDGYIIVSVILPAAITAVCLIAAGLNGRKYVIKDMYMTLLELLYFWR